MKLITFRTKETADANENYYRVGSIGRGGRIADLTELVSDTPLDAADVLECFDLDSGFINEAAAAAEKVRSLERSEASLCPPVPRPGKVICIGLNYRDHAEESGMAIPASPIIFSKFPTSVTGPNSTIELPAESSEVDYEAELAFIVGRRASGVAAAEALEYVFGYTNFNDVSARDLQFADGQWQRGKSCDTFAPMGEYAVTRDEIADPHKLRISFRLNGETLQDSTTGQMIFRIPELVEFLSRSITLEPGDVVATGTPPGVGFARSPKIFLRDGDLAEVEIEGLGTLRNPVRARAR